MSPSVLHIQIDKSPFFLFIRLINILHRKKSRRGKKEQHLLTTYHNDGIRFIADGTSMNLNGALSLNPIYFMLYYYNNKTT